MKFSPLVVRNFIFSIICSFTFYELLVKVLLSEQFIVLRKPRTLWPACVRRLHEAGLEGGLREESGINSLRTVLEYKRDFNLCEKNL